MFNSRLFTQTYFIVVTMALAFTVAIYFFTTSVVDQVVSKIEQSSSKTVLDNVHQLVAQVEREIREYRTTAIHERQRELKNIIAMTEGVVKLAIKRGKENNLTKKQIRNQLIDDIRNFRYGNDDYVWVADYNNVLISHPSPDLHGFDASKLRDVHGELIVKPMVEIALEKDEGLYTYWWQRLGRDEPSEKISYFKKIPELEFIIGTGLYVDDVEQEVERRKELAIETMRSQLHKITIANTGYIYIYNSSHEMIIHPNANIEKRNIQALLDPISHRPMVELLLEVADIEQGLHYKWDKPSDPGNYIYDKISWVRSFAPFDWYIASSIYTEELNKGSQLIGQRIMAVTVGFLILAAMLGYLFVRGFTTPIHKLSEAAKRVADGDLSPISKINRRDEIGTLSTAFNTMVMRLREDIELLDARIRKRTSELETANQAKSRFLAAASHDLRQPLNSMGLFLATLSRRVQREDNKKLVNNLQISFDSLTGLLDSLLDISKLDAGVVKVKVGPFPLAPLFSSLAMRWTPVATEKGLELHIIPNHAIIISDYASLERIIGNLISNAIRYTDHGKILVGCRRDADQIRVEIWDTGIGIPEQRLDEIFDEFVQLGNPERDQKRGLGLGLSIVMRLAELLGHQVKVSSIEGKGSVFSITLPFSGINKNNTPQQNNTVNTLDNAEKRTVLIIDDDQTSLLGMETLLTDWGWHSITATSGDEAIKQMSENGLLPNVIIADYRLRAGETGTIAIKKIREASGMTIPALIVTGDTAPERIKELEHSGFHVLHKPIKPRELGAILRFLLRSNYSDQAHT